MISRLRDIFHVSKPSHDLFVEVIKVVRANPSPEVVDYALGHLDSWTDQNLRRLHVYGFPAIDPSLSLFRSLGMWGNIGPEGARSLTASPYLKNLTCFDLSDNHIGDKGAAALAASPNLQDLTTLNLGWNGIGDAGAAALAASPHLKNLTTLILRGNVVGVEGAAALAASPNFKNTKVVL